MINPRVDVIVNLHFTWEGVDLDAPIVHHLVIAKAPSPTKDALSLGWLEGELLPHDSGLKGELRLTEAGRDHVLALRQGWAAQ